MSDNTNTVTPPVPATPPTPPAAPPKPKGGIALAALVLGIVAIVLAIIPGPSFVAFIPALIAVALGIAALARKVPSRGRALTGLILGAIAFVLAIIMSSVAIGAGVNAVAKHGAASGLDNKPAAAAPAPAAKPKPTPVKTAAPIPANAVYSGSGDSIVKVQLPDGPGSPVVGTISYTGGDNFSVWSLDSSLTKQSLLVNTIGHYAGTVLFDVQSGQQTNQLQITASGPWKVTLRSIRSLREFTGSKASGTGDDVVIYRGAAAAATITNSGKDNFAVWEYGDQTSLAVNEIGAYSGMVPFSAGPALIAVTSDGAWNIAAG
jgi:hypothetical protein